MVGVAGRSLRRQMFYCDSREYMRGVTEYGKKINSHYVLKGVHI